MGEFTNKYIFNQLLFIQFFVPQPKSFFNKYFIFLDAQLPQSQHKAQIPKDDDKYRITEIIIKV